MYVDKIIEKFLKEYQDGKDKLLKMEASLVDYQDGKNEVLRKYGVKPDPDIFGDKSIELR